MPKPSQLLFFIIIHLTAVLPAVSQDALPGAFYYRVRIQLTGDSLPIEGRVKVTPTPARITGNRVQRARFGSWQLAPQSGGAAPDASMTLLMSRLERLLYMAGPSNATRRTQHGMLLRDQLHQLWTVDIPSGVTGRVHLIEAAPNVLVLSDLAVRFNRGSVLRIEAQLEHYAISKSFAPPEDGAALLRTMQNWVETE